MCDTYVHFCAVQNVIDHFGVFFSREVKVRVLKSDPLAWVTGSLTRRKTSTETFLLTLQKVHMPYPHVITT